ncbi:MAG: 3-deoxy-D-manno-octulosonic acid transferase [Thermoguttaceae bacterium]|nr:3-deoxy-D-manno-octulosonic acid transferase [Thermoguttaceae bacterium]
MVLNLIYLATLVAAFPLLLYRSLRHKKYREGLGAKLLGLVPDLPSPPAGVKRIWFHAVSVGEVNLLKTLVAELDASGEGWEFVVSSTSKTGYALAVKLFADRVPVFYCPLDFTWSVKRALRRIKPDALALVELEVWPNLICRARRYGAKVVIVNGRVADGSFLWYRRAKRFFARVFASVDLVVAQDELAASRFRELVPDQSRVLVSGSLKFDGAQTDRDNPGTRRLAQLAGITESDVVFLCGSTQAPEEEAGLDVYRSLRADYPNLRLILAPRHPERFAEVARLLDASEFAWTRRSTLTLGDTCERILLVDAVGELAAWWGPAQIGFVGGSWGSRGGQNMLEPAGYGVAVSFGPNTQNFRTIVESLLSARAAVVAANPEEMRAFVKRCLAEPEYRRALGLAARNLTLSNQGATKRTVDAIASVMKGDSVV